MIGFWLRMNVNVQAMILMLTIQHMLPLSGLFGNPTQEIKRASTDIPSVQTFKSKKKSVE